MEDFRTKPYKIIISKDDLKNYLLLDEEEKKKFQIGLNALRSEYRGPRAEFSSLNSYNGLRLEYFDMGLRFTDCNIHNAVHFSVSSVEHIDKFINRNYVGEARKKHELSTREKYRVIFKDCNFYNVTFHNVEYCEIIFNKCKFHGFCRFTHVETNKKFIFRDCYFEEVPNFVRSEFKHAPLLYSCEIKEYPKQTQNFKELVGDKELFYLHHRYAALKKLAIQANDYERELNFFASELKTHPERNVRFFAFLYGIFSNFGRSIAIPLIWLIVTIVSMGYFNYTSRLAQDKCLAGDMRYSPLGSAFSIAFDKSLPLSSLLTPERAKENYICLYGTRKTSNEMTEKQKEDYEKEPFIPQTVNFVGTLQTLFSLMCLFFFGLGLRNRFKIKTS